MNFDKVNIHPNFKSYGSWDDFDLAVLRFRLRIVTFSYKVSPICIPETSELLNIFKNFYLCN